MHDSGDTTQTNARPRNGRRAATYREATINRDRNGNPIGIGLFITVAELRALDVGPASGPLVGFEVRDGEARWTSPDREVGDE